MKIIRKRPEILFELIILCFFFTAAALASIVYSDGPLCTSSLSRLQSPSAGHIFGTDEYGRDILSRSCYGLRISLLIGISVVTLSGSAGVVIGLLCGWNEKADKLISRILDGLMAFPEIILAISLAAIWGPGVRNIILALSTAFFPKMARVIRGCVISLKSRVHILSGKAAGAGTARLILRYVLPGCVSAALVQATFCFASAILSEAALSFLGVGLKDPAPSLGGMVSAGRNYMTVAPWTILIPGAIIMAIVLVLNLLGDSLRDALDPMR